MSTQLIAIDSPATLEHVLALVLTPDSSAVALAEVSLRPFLKNSSAAIALLQQMSSSQNAGVRQVASVLLRSRIGRFWSKLSEADRSTVKTTLLSLLLSEPQSIIRLAHANLVAVLAKYTMPAQQWPELLPFVGQCFQSPELIVREMSLRLVESMLSNVGKSIAPFLGNLMHMLHAALVDPQIQIKAAALKCVDELMENIETEEQSNQLLALVPHVLEAMAAMIQGHQEDPLLRGIDVLVQLSESFIEEMTQHVPAMVSICIAISQADGIDDKIRERALEYIVFVAQLKATLLYKKNALLEPILSAMFHVLSLPSEEGKVGIDAFHCLTEVVPARVLWPLCVKLISTFPNPRGSLYAIGVLSDTCNEQVRDSLSQIVPFVVSMVPVERDAACFALASMSDYVQPDILDYHATLLPVLVSSLNEVSLYVLDAFCENLGEAILPYLPGLMGALGAAVGHSDKTIAGAAISAVASVALAAKEAFLPYAPSVLDYLESLLSVTSNDKLVQRARATECIGNIAVATGVDVIRHRINNIVSQSLAGFALHFSELNEYTYGLFVSLVDVMGEELSAILPQLASHAIAACQSTDGIVATQENNSQSLNFRVEDDEEDDDEYDDDDDDDITLRIHTSVMDEKAAAIMMLAKFAEKAPASMAPFAVQAAEAVLSLSQFMHEHVRVNIPEALHRYALLCSTQSGEEPARIVDLCWHTLIVYMVEDEDKECVAKACEALSQLLDTVPHMAQHYAADITSRLMSLLRKEGACQRPEADDDEEEQNADDLLTDSIGDCGIALAKALGPQFAPFFEQLLPLYVRWLDPKKSENERVMATGAIAESAAQLGQGFPQFVAHVYPIALRGAQQSAEVDVQRNCVYMLGAVAMNGGAAAVPHVPEILGTLHHVLSRTSDGAVRDNIAGAVVRIMKARVVPAETVLQPLLSLLPLKTDFLEACEVSRSLRSLKQDPAVQQVYPRILAATVHSAVAAGKTIPQQLAVETKAAVKEACEAVGSQKVSEWLGRDLWDAAQPLF